MKKCLYCDGEILDEATSCNFCGNEVDTRTSLTSAKESREPIWLRVLYKEAFKEVSSAREFRLGVEEMAPFVMVFGLGMAVLFLIVGDTYYAGVVFAITMTALFLWLLIRRRAILPKIKLDAVLHYAFLLVFGLAMVQYLIHQTTRIFAIGILLFIAVYTFFDMKK